MENEKKILIKFILYFLLGLFIIFYGITHKFVPMVLADTINVGYVTDKTTILYENNNAQAMVSLPVNNTINQYLYDILVIQLDNVTITKDYTYMLELYLPDSKLKNINNIYVVGGNNNGTTCQTIGLDNSNNSYPKIYFKCPTNLSHLTIGLNNDSPATNTQSITTGNNFRWSYSYLRYYTEDDDIDLSPIIGNATTNTNNIINNNNTNTDKIINNQNELFGSKCDNLFNYNMSPTDNFLGNFTYTINNGIFTFNGTDSNYKFIGYNITLTKGTYYWGGIENGTGSDGISSMLVFNNNTLFCDNSNCSFTLDTDTTISFYPFRLGGSSYTANNLIIKPYISKTSPSFCEFGSYSSKLDEQTKTSKGILGKLGDLFNTLFSSEDADISGLDNMVGWLPPGPVDSIINLPLSLFNALINTLTGTCHDVSLTLPFVNQTLVLPCFDAYMTRYLDNFGTFWTLIGSILSIFILYNYLLALYKWVDDTLTFRENNLPGYYDDNWGGGA